MRDVFVVMDQVTPAGPYDPRHRLRGCCQGYGIGNGDPREGVGHGELAAHGYPVPDVRIDAGSCLNVSAGDLCFLILPMKGAQGPADSIAEVALDAKLVDEVLLLRAQVSQRGIRGARPHERRSQGSPRAEIPATIQRRRVPNQLLSSHCGAARAGIDCGTLPAAPREMRFSGVLKNPEDG